MTSEDDTSPMADADSDTGLLPDAECIDLLSSNRRRILLRALCDAEEREHSLETLAATVAQTEQGTDLGDVATHRIGVSLHHVHLPRLDDADVLDYDRETNTVRFYGSDRIETWLATMRDD
ncbi:hypothetical protein NDI85_03210 [Halomicroarcula sp. S1AR25-4]|uniref:DUF7344 domain-containing protein n=1 Tax=Haloarcula sp. S1AR25-4 TaxID=2950538 RepID=UPI002875CCC9|nr:hypothetical protein [Halomicroarcula sp. S1AR25-4]MDS0276788.1 hypothetical protein [Halomicroarcula sp. S1AR25-4]